MWTSGAGRFEVAGYTCLRRLDDPVVGGDWTVLARRESDRTEVVVRLFARRLTTARDRQRFEREVSGLRALDGVAHVVPLLAAGIDREGRAHLVTPYCVAGSLHDHLLAVGRLTADEVRRIGIKLATALAEVHRHDLVHRNITPSNVLLDGAGQPVLSDFGLVSLALTDDDFMPELTREYRLFLAPEAYLPELMTPSADIFALGVTLYTLLAGGAPAAFPIDGADLPSLAHGPAPLMDVLRCATALDPRDRFRSAGDLRAALLAAV